MRDIFLSLPPRCLTSTVLYLNTASLTNAREVREGSIVSNVTEAGLVRDVCQALLKGGELLLRELKCSRLTSFFL